MSGKREENWDSKEEEEVAAAEVVEEPVE